MAASSLEHCQNGSDNGHRLTALNWRISIKFLCSSQNHMSFLKRLFSLPEHVLVPYRVEAEAELRTIRVTGEDLLYCVDGQTAQVLNQSESVEHDDGKVQAFYLTQIVRNTSGEYFLFKTTGGKPYTKHLTQQMAKHLLGSKYLLPNE